MARTARDVDIPPEALEAAHRVCLHNRARHERETNHQLARGVCCSREKLRQLRKVVHALGLTTNELEQQGIGVHRQYAALKGDDRVPLYVKIPAPLKDALVEAAVVDETTLSELVTTTLTQIFGEVRGVSTWRQRKISEAVKERTK